MKGLRLFLAASGVAILVIGALYGIAPRFVFERVLGLSLQQEQLHIFRAIMGLYLGIGGLLLYAAGDARRYRAGLLLETVFLGGLGSGRLLSFAVDGTFHGFALLAVAVEVPMFLICLYLLARSAAPEPGASCAQSNR